MRSAGGLEVVLGVESGDDDVAVDERELEQGVLREVDPSLEGGIPDLAHERDDLRRVRVERLHDGPDGRDRGGALAVAVHGVAVVGEEDGVCRLLCGAPHVRLVGLGDAQLVCDLVGVVAHGG